MLFTLPLLGNLRQMLLFVLIFSRLHDLHDHPPWFPCMVGFALNFLSFDSDSDDGIDQDALLACIH